MGRGPGVLQSMESQRTGHNWPTEPLNYDSTVHLGLLDVIRLRRGVHVIAFVKVFKNQKVLSTSGDIHYVKLSIDGGECSPETEIRSNYG